MMTRRRWKKTTVTEITLIQEAENRQKRQKRKKQDEAAKEKQQAMKKHQERTPNHRLWLSEKTKKKADEGANVNV